MHRLRKINKLTIGIASLLVLLFSMPLHAEHGFQPFTAIYTVSRNNTDIGIRTHTLSLENDHYIYRANMHATGFASLFKSGEITEVSHWALYNDTVVPLSYEYRDTDKEKRHAQLEFDWETNSVTNKVSNKSWKMTIPNGTQDKFSYMLALMQDLQHGKKNTEYKIADGGRLKTYQFKILKNETITTPIGKFNTIKLQRVRAGKKNRITYLWVLPEKNYLPIKIERHKGDNLFTMIISELR